MLKKILEHNKQFVEKEGYKPFLTSKFPDKKVAMLTCMDARLVELLPAAIGYKNGEIKIIKNAGGIISHPFGSVVRSLIVAIYELNVDTIWVIGHTDCGMQHFDVPELLNKMENRGISRDVINQIAYCGIDYEQWLSGFANVEESILQTMKKIDEHPLIPKDITIEGLLIDSVTGELISIGTIAPSSQL